RSSAASTTLKTAVFAPMPIAMIATAISEKPGALTSERSAYRISDHVSLAGDRAGDEPRGGKRPQIEAGIAPGDHIGENAAGSRRMLKAVAAEAVDQKQPVHAVGGADNRVAVRRHLVEACP